MPIISGIDEATSMALVLNELVQNAVEHGFRTLNDGRIHIRLEETANRLRLRVINDGEPLPPGFTTRSTESLGLSIIETLVRGDLNGSFTLENEPNGTGIVATVTVPR